MDHVKESFCYRFSDSMLSKVLASQSFIEHGGPFLTLRQQFNSRGWLRVWEAKNSKHLAKVLHLWVHNSEIGLDSNMISVFAQQKSPMPHLTCHYVGAPNNQFSFHTDLLPRVDPVMHPDYVNHVYKPLTHSFHQTKEILGYWSRSSEHEYLMSGWGVFGENITFEQMMKVRPVIESYFSHFINLLETKIPHGNVSEHDLSSRHRKQVLTLFNRDTDPDSYGILDNLFGSEITDQINEIHINDMGHN